MKYYILVGKDRLTDRWEMLFGDYERDVVEAEREDVRESSDYEDYGCLRIVTLPMDDQDTIDAYLYKLNN